MAWTAPSGHVYAVGEIVTAATLNTYVKDNLIDLDRRTNPVADFVGTDQQTTSTTYTNLATVGPAVTVTIGAGANARCLVSMYAALYNNTALFIAAMSYALSGATTRAALDTVAISFAPAAGGVAYGARVGNTIPDFGLAQGSTTFTAKYAALTGNTAGFADRRLIVTPLGA